MTETAKQWADLHDLWLETDQALLKDPVARTFDFRLRLHVTAAQLKGIKETADRYGLLPEMVVMLRAFWAGPTDWLDNMFSHKDANMDQLRERDARLRRTLDAYSREIELILPRPEDSGAFAFQQAGHEARVRRIVQMLQGCGYEVASHDSRSRSNDQPPATVITCLKRR